MKILLTSDLNPSQVNGVIVSVLNLMKELEKKGHDVRLLCLSPNHHSYSSGKTYYVGSMPLNIYPDVRASLMISSKLLDEVCDWCPDIIHSQCEFFTYSFVERIAKRCKAPIVHTYHTLYEHYVQYVLPGQVMQDLIAPVMRVRLRTADVVIAPTRKTKRLLFQKGVADHVVVIPTGIDLSKYEVSLSEEERKAMVRKLDIPEDALIYGSVGRLAEEKNLDEVLQAHKRLLEERPDVYLVLVGDGKYRKQLEEEVDSLEIRDRVRFTGMVSPDEVGKYYRLFSFFISASVSETQGLTYIEALANGRPVIARRDDAPVEVIQEGVDGFIFDTIDQAVDRIKALVDDPDRLAAMSRAAWDSREAFGTERFGDRVNALYERVLETPGKSQLERERIMSKLADQFTLLTDRSDYGKFYDIMRAKWSRASFRMKTKSLAKKGSLK